MNEEPVGGRVAITTRAFERTVSAIAAQRLGVPVRDVRIQVSDVHGLLSIAVTGPMRVAALRDPQRGPGILTRIETARTQIRDDVTTILGSKVGVVSVTVSRAVILEQKRVR